MSTLRGIKPAKIKKRLKMFVYGAAGVGKTMAAIQFPNPYIIDTEKGCENNRYVELIEKSDGALFQSSNFDDVLKEVEALSKEKHHYKTLVIDSMTVLYDCLIFDEEKKVGNKYGAHTYAAKKKMNHFINILYNLDMNIIMTSHMKKEYGDNMTLLGNTFDTYKNLDHLFDLVIEVMKSPVSGKRIGVVKKTRVDGFSDNDTFEFNYGEICSRYSKEIMEKECKTIEPATQDQVDELSLLIVETATPVETVEKWLAKAGVNDISEMTTDIIQKCISSLKNKAVE